MSDKNSNQSQNKDSSKGANSKQYKRPLGWKIYFFALTALSVYSFYYYLTLPQAGIAEYLSFAIAIVTTVGMFGFVFVKAIAKPQVWLLAVIASIAINIAYFWLTNLDLHAGLSSKEYYVANAVGWLIALPAYYSLYLYSKVDDPAWKKK